MTLAIQRPIRRRECIAQGFASRFKAERVAFLAAIHGISSEEDRATYLSLMLNRLMFAYFLQHQGLLDGDLDYLCRRLSIMQSSKGQDSFYRHFLLRFFHEGLGRQQRQTTDPLLGNIPGLDLGLFKEHPLEQTSSPVFIADEAFKRLFAFFDTYRWRIDERLPHSEHDPHPDLLGSFCQQPVHQREMGAYYTREDVTEYITARTIIPRLLEAVKARCPLAFQPHGSIWRLLQSDPDRYIYRSVRSIDSLPLETEREYRRRRSHYERLRTVLLAGDVHSVHALITYNLDIHQFARDVLEQCEEPNVLQACYDFLTQITVLDPTCGTGAFLLAALRTLEPLYELCIRRLQEVGKETGQPDRSTSLASIITNNLYGVDIMEESVEVCKLRLYLELLSRSESLESMRLPPAINAHIRTGNALVGCVHEADSRNPIEGDQSSTTKSPCPFHWCIEFEHIMRQGGFDVIVGNPPYVEYSKLKQDDAGPGYEHCGNLYVAILERSLTLCRPESSYLGLIVPLSICGSERFRPLRATLVKHTSSLWLSNFEIFPSRLFDAAFQRLSILLAKHGTGTPRTTSVTRLQRWYTAERPHVFPLITYTPTDRALKPGVFPKLASPQHAAILHKMQQQSEGSSIATALCPQRTEYFVYYQEATNYWVKATCRVPFYRKNGAVMVPPHSRLLFFRDEVTARSAMALMNSSLFYLWFVTYSDGFHLSHTLVKEFPVAHGLWKAEALQELAVRLETDIQAHACTSTRNTRAGDQIEIEEYRMGHSKQLIDAIDRVLATYYNFTSEELDFIVNYDIKYRMGRSSATP